MKFPEIQNTTRKQTLICKRFYPLTRQNKHEQSLSMDARLRKDLHERHQHPFLWLDTWRNIFIQKSIIYFKTYAWAGEDFEYLRRLNVLLVKKAESQKT